MTSRRNRIAIQVLVLTMIACAAVGDTGRQIESALQSELAFWYPAAVDTAHDGFLVPGDQDEPRTKQIVYQSRLLWVAAEVVRQHPELADRFNPIVAHGVASLRDHMWDAERGGFYWELTQDNRLTPELRQEKHVYGNAFGIYAAANAYRAGGDEGALKLAVDAYRWLESHARDREQVGYIEHLALDGTPLFVAPSDEAPTLVGAYGYKSMNTHLHLLEAYTTLYQVWPDEQLRSRLGELYEIMRDRIHVDGALNLFFTRDWRPVPDGDSFGHDVEAAFLMLEAAEALGHEEHEAAKPIARGIVDHALKFGYDTEHGGLYDMGTMFRAPLDTTKVWWTQAEAVNAFLLMHTLYGSETPRYREAFEQTWSFTQSRLIDPDSGTWLWSVEAEGEVADDTLAANWKAPYHTTRALLNCLRMLSEHGQ